jgi:hypothetical protein
MSRYNSYSELGYDSSKNYESNSNKSYDSRNYTSGSVVNYDTTIGSKNYITSSRSKSSKKTSNSNRVKIFDIDDESFLKKYNINKKAHSFKIIPGGKTGRDLDIHRVKNTDKNIIPLKLSDKKVIIKHIKEYALQNKLIDETLLDDILKFGIIPEKLSKNDLDNIDKVLDIYSDVSKMILRDRVCMRHQKI